MGAPSIAILGLGGIGSMYAAKIAAAGQSPVLVIADEARRARWRETPPTFNGAPLPLRVAIPHEAADIPAPEVILLAVKSPQLPGALEMLPPFIGPQTQVLPLLNGLSSEEQTAARIGWEHVLYAFVYCHTAVRDGSAVVQDGPAVLVFGEAENPPPFTPRVQRVAEILGALDIEFRIPADMRAAQWEKYILNAGLNQASALLNALHGEFQHNPDAMAFLRALIQEAAALGKALGIPGVEEFPARAEAAIRTLPPDCKTSMAQDAAAGRPTELTLFAGWIVPRAEALGIPVPANRLVLECLGGGAESIGN